MYPDYAPGRKEIQVRSEDSALLQFRLENGGIGSVVLSEVSAGRMNRLSLEITGEKQNLWWNSEENQLLYSAQKGTGVHQEVFGFGNGFSDTFLELIKRFYAQNNADTLLEHPDYPTFAEGAAVVRLCDAIYESALSGAVWKSVREENR